MLQENTTLVVWSGETLVVGNVEITGPAAIEAERLVDFGAWQRIAGATLAFVDGDTAAEMLDEMDAYNVHLDQRAAELLAA